MSDGLDNAQRRASLRSSAHIELLYESLPSTGSTGPKVRRPTVDTSSRKSFFASSVSNSFNNGNSFSNSANATSTTQAPKTPETQQQRDKENVNPSQTRDNTDTYQKVRALIFGKAMQYNVTKAETKTVNFTDIADIDDEALENHVREDLAAGLGEGDAFKLVMLFVILLNSLVIGLSTIAELYKYNADVFTQFNQVFIGIFLMEIFFKWYYGFKDFWTSGWNILDLILVIASCLSYCTLSTIQLFNYMNYTKIDNVLLEKVAIFRILRIFQPFKSQSLSVVSGLQIIVNTIADSVPDMFNISILLFVLMYIYAIIGVALFSHTIPYGFKDIGRTMFTLFVAFTQIGWVEILDQLERKGQFIAGSIYFLSFILVGVFILMKTVVAVVVANLEEAYQQQQQLQKLKSRRLKSNFSNPKTYKGDKHLSTMPEGDADVWLNQIPFEIPDLDKISKDQVEKYLLILSIIEENLKEYANIKSQLTDILNEVKAVNSRMRKHYSEDALNEPLSAYRDSDVEQPQKINRQATFTKRMSLSETRKITPSFTGKSFGIPMRDSSNMRQSTTESISMRASVITQESSRSSMKRESSVRKSVHRENSNSQNVFAEASRLDSKSNRF